MLDLDSHQIKVDLAENTVLEVELTLIELEFYMQALFNADLHLDGPIRLRLLALVAHDELLLLRYSIIVPIYYYVNVIPKSNHNTVIGLKLLFDSIELEVVGDVFRECTWWLQIPHNLQENRILVLIVQILDDADELDSNTQMINSFVFVERNAHLSLDVLAVLNKSQISD